MTSSYGEPVAALYDALNPWGPSDDFYLPYVLAATSVVDVGCGTGTLLCGARTAGHRGIAYGVDPSRAMLDVARAKCADVTWAEADAASFALPAPVELAVMTGHAFQALLTDDAVLAALANVRAHLVPGGRFVFETRNPAARAWEGWTPDRTRTVVPSAEGDVEVTFAVARTVPPDLVEYDAVHRTASGTRRVSDTLRFVDVEHLLALVAAAGLVVEETYGDWDRSPLRPTSPEVVVVAARPA